MSSAIGDVNGDAYLGVATTNSGRNDVMAPDCKGGGRFALLGQYSTGSSPQLLE